MSNYSSIFYKADQRSIEAGENNKSFSTLSADAALGELYTCDDVFLLPGKEIVYRENADTLQLILPVAGSLVYKDADVKDKPVSSEELLYSFAKTYSLKNNYSDNTVNFLRIVFRSNLSLMQQSAVYPVAFKEYNTPASLHLNTLKNNSYACTALYKTRVKSTYALKDTTNRVFAMVINGAFEVEERLMEHRDALVLWNVKEIEFESLSEFAILLIIETHLNKI